MTPRSVISHAAAQSAEAAADAADAANQAAASAQYAADAASSGGESIEQQLLDLQDLLDQGLITQDDYDKKKDDLLADM